MVGCHSTDFDYVQGYHIPSYFHSDEENVKDRTSMACFRPYQGSMEGFKLATYEKDQNLLEFVQEDGISIEIQASLGFRVQSCLLSHSDLHDILTTLVVFY